MNRRLFFNINLIVILLLFQSAGTFAGTYIFASEANGVDIITHPSPYTGSGGTVTVRVCIDPASANAAAMEYSVQNIVNAYNQMIPTFGNVELNSNNNIPANYLDFESVVLHEVGHCLGMGHINAASESGLSGDQQNYTKATDGANNVLDLDAGADGIIGSSDDLRGDDVNLLWFRKSNNDPFTIDNVIDATTYSRNVADLPATHNYPANADRAVSSLLGYAKTEAVMQQGTYFDEAQRTLGHDDIATLRYAASGIDELESGGPANRNANDNYNIVLENGGVSAANCDISMSFTDTTSLAFCGVGGQGLATNHVRITTASIEIGQAYNWYFNAPNTAPVLNSIGNANMLDWQNLVVNISATDVDSNPLSYSVSGLPAFASFVDNADGTATLTVSPAVGEDSLTSVTVTVSDNAEPALSASETFDIDVSLDSDTDGLSDDDEIIYGTSVNNPDTDGDGLIDGDEVFIYTTSPTNPDSDGDFISDGDEVNGGGDPLDAASWPNIADGDIAPLGSPDGVINAADYLVAQRIVIGDVAATSLELAHGDLYPAGSPDGVINTSDLILLLKLVQ